jgi:hypothetical protein
MPPGHASVTLILSREEAKEYTRLVRYPATLQAESGRDPAGISSHAGQEGTAGINSHAGQEGNLGY